MDELLRRFTDFGVGSGDFSPPLAALILVEPVLADDRCRMGSYEWLQVRPARAGRGNCQAEQTSVTAACPPHPRGGQRVWHPGLGYIDFHVRLANLSGVRGGAI
jgi:hypothetical protein